MKGPTIWWKTYAARLGLVASLSSCATGSASAPASAPAAVAVGTAVPALALHDPSGQPLPLQSMSDKVVLLDIWASWCLPCKEELPLLDELAGRLAGTGVEIIAVSIDEDKAAMNEFLSLKKSWHLRLAHDPQHRVADVLRPDKMPSSYLIDRGVLRRIYGGFNRNDIAMIESSLKELSHP